MKMTKNVALTTALTFVPEEQTEVREVLTKMIAQLSKPRNTSEDAKARAAAKRKEKAAAERLTLVSQVIPVLREVITTDMTAKEIFTTAQERLPQDFTVNKVQAVLLREMKDELIKTETKGRANTYRLAE